MSKTESTDVVILIFAAVIIGASSVTGLLVWGAWIYRLVVN